MGTAGPILKEVAALHAGWGRRDTASAIIQPALYDGFRCVAFSALRPDPQSISLAFLAPGTC